MKLREALKEKEEDIKILKAEQNELLKKMNDTIETKNKEIESLKAWDCNRIGNTNKGEPSFDILKMRNNRMKKKLSGKNLQVKRNLQRSQQNKNEEVTPVKLQMKLLVPVPTPPPLEGLSPSPRIDEKSLNF